MKKLKLTHLYLFFLIMCTTTGCELVGDIFEFGVWVGVILVVLVLLFIMWLVGKFFR
ncbi:hypothetical protein C900_03627 [Fulvivirga imtechensis AK7]|uniref:Phosphatidate cytidylyltransferase n=1 Tax=Fulvivirga imtechensis AK7 TaxID=1237149 RepID=L8JNV8_9BACT|nr:hypothetical protein [Fulvivirga imtechensis]ELR70646.1 hypothetical protein C900_03627 [Fulvivirga imtechensis AK7]